MTYGRIVCDVREVKAENNRTILTVIGDRINYPDSCITPTANIITIKNLVNIIISTKRSYLMTLDIKVFYINTPLTSYEYIRMKLKHFPEDIIKQYKL